MFLARSTSTLGTSSLLRCGDPPDELAPPLDGVEGAGIHAPVLVDPEVGVGGLEQGVVLGRLDVSSARRSGPGARPGARKMASVVEKVPHMPPPP